MRFATLDVAAIVQFITRTISTSNFSRIPPVDTPARAVETVEMRTR